MWICNTFRVCLKPDAASAATWSWTPSDRHRTVPGTRRCGSSGGDAGFEPPWTLSHTADTETRAPWCVPEINKWQSLKCVNIKLTTQYFPKNEMRLVCWILITDVKLYCMQQCLLVCHRLRFRTRPNINNPIPTHPIIVIYFLKCITSNFITNKYMITENKEYF